jgi:hypothetical protein
MKCQYALKPSDAVSKHLGDKHEIRAKAHHGLNAFVKQLQLPDPSRLEPRADGCAPHRTSPRSLVWPAGSASIGLLA